MGLHASSHFRPHAGNSHSRAADSGAADPGSPSSGAAHSSATNSGAADACTADACAHPGHTCTDAKAGPLSSCGDVRSARHGRMLPLRRQERQVRLEVLAETANACATNSGAAYACTADACTADACTTDADSSSVRVCCSDGGLQREHQRVYFSDQKGVRRLLPESTDACAADACAPHACRADSRASHTGSSDPSPADAVAADPSAHPCSHAQAIGNASRRGRGGFMRGHSGGGVCGRCQEAAASAGTPQAAAAGGR
jgi:hypothetical protein